MKKTLYLLLLPVLLFACNGNKTQPIKDTVSIVPSTDNSKALIAEFKPKIQGVWVKSSYVDKVIVTKSPLAAVDEANDITVLVIDTHKLIGDSIMVEVGWGNHDSSDMALSFKPGKMKSSLVFGAGDLEYAIVNGDTTLTYYRPDEQGNKITSTRFRRAQLYKGDGLGEGLYKLINKGLVAGSYTLTDSTGVSATVSFTADGKIKGFEQFKRYYINIDLNSDAMDNLDQIGFSNSDTRYKWYSFKIDANTLKLYNTRPNADSTLLVLDKLRYTLVKQKK